jgi:hypothetical protein
MARTQLTGNIRVFVNNNVPFVYDPLSSVQVFRTLQDAWNYVATQLDLNGFNATIQLVDSVTPYDGVAMSTPPLASGGQIIITGNPADLTKVTVQAPSSSSNIFVNTGSPMPSPIPVFIQNMTISDAGRASITFFRMLGGAVSLANIIFNLSGTGNGTVFFGSQYASLQYGGSFALNCTGSPSIASLINARFGANIGFAPTSPSMTGALTVNTGVVFISSMGFVNWVPATATWGAGITGPQINMNSGYLECNGNGLTPIPGQAGGNVGGATTGAGWVH